MIHFYDQSFPDRDEPLNKGVPKAVGGLAAAFVRDGHPVTVLTDGEIENEYERDGYAVRAFRRENPYRPASGLRDYVSRMPEGPILLNGMFNPPVARLARQMRLDGRPYLFAPHDPYNAAMFASGRVRKAVWWHFVDRPLLEGAEAVQVLDARHGRLLEERGIATPWFVVPNGCPEGSLDAPWSTLEAHRDPLRVIFLGRMDAHNKGLDLVLGALARVPGIHLTLQGPDWGDRPSLEGRAESLGVRDRVRFLDADYDRTAGELIASHDAFCLPSRFEGFGIAALEAMIAARPVLITDVGGLAPHVRDADCGVVVEATCTALEDGFQTLLARRGDLPDMGLRGRRYAAEHLTWDAIAHASAEHYVIVRA
jgi:glycosyltransferase involved in cell wall biosynthesis